jgi:broad specificity phosphatase PhoE
MQITYFVHGTTTDNEKHLATGWSQGELSKKGIQQSKELPKQIGNKKFDVVFCSDLKRAIDSAELSFKGKYPIIQDKRLRECNYGDLNEAPADSFKDKIQEYVYKQFPNGESYKDVERRMRDFISFLRKNYAGKQVAIVAHQAPQLALDVILRGRTWQEAIAEDWRKKKAWQPGWEYIVS